MLTQVLTLLVMGRCCRLASSTLDTCQFRLKLFMLPAALLDLFLQFLYAVFSILRRSPHAVREQAVSNLQIFACFLFSF
jgi:hypothetical protein